jgi:NDP-sugar pyrophosphorylase family protein
VIARLDRYIEEGRVNEYYETVFAEMVADASLEFDAVLFNENKWYEIDAMEDLHQAELMFPRAPAIGLPEHVGFEHVISRSAANSANMASPVNKTLVSDNVVSINKAEPEKIQ